MVTSTGPLTRTSLTSFLSEVEAVLSVSQPRLTARALEGKIIIAGTLVCSGPEGPFDEFEIALGVLLGFPSIEPLVCETGGRIPHDPDRHVFPSDGQCCICIWEEWLWEVEEPSFREFVEGPLHSYFVSQSMFEQTGEWPFGDRAHDVDGLMDAYRGILQLEDDADVLAYIRLLRLKNIKGHHDCPCRSGKKVRHCHRSFLAELKSKVPAFLIEMMDRKLSAYSG